MWAALDVSGVELWDGSVLCNRLVMANQGNDADNNDNADHHNTSMFLFLYMYSQAFKH